MSVSVPLARPVSRSALRSVFNVSAGVHWLLLVTVWVHGWCDKLHASFFEEEDCKSARKKWKRRGDGNCHRENPRETRYKLPSLLPPTNDSKHEKARTQEKMRTRARAARPSRGTKLTAALRSRREESLGFTCSTTETQRIRWI